MNNEWIGTSIGILLFVLYIFGLYNIIADDHRYTTKDVVIGAVVFPYPWWVGGKELYRFAVTSSEQREMEEKCLDASEAIGMPQKARLRFCECFAETQNRDACIAKILTK